MNKKISLTYFLKRRTKSFYQVMRQIADKSHCIRKKKFLSVRKCNISYTGLKSSKKHIFFKYFFTFSFIKFIYEFIHNSRFSGISISYKRNNRDLIFFTLFSLDISFLNYIFQFFVKKLYTMLYSSVINFQFCFSGTTIGSTGSTALLIQLFITAGTHSGKLILKSRNFYLKLCFFCFCTFIKNIQNKLSPVYNLYIKKFFEISDLIRGKLIIEDDHINIRFGNDFF